jgi:hypothetical protein
MKINKTGVLAAIAIAEGILLVSLFASGYRGIRVIVKPNPVSFNPLELAAEFEAPDKKFEELVKKYPSWMRYRKPLSKNESGMSILTSCAIMKNTNYVRILIVNGANVEEAVTELNKVGADGAIKLLRQLQSESRVQKEAAPGSTNDSGKFRDQLRE